MQRDTDVLVNRLTLVVVLGMPLAVRPGDRLRSFIRLESKVAQLMLLGFLVLAEAVVTKHQIIVRLQILGIDGQSSFKFSYCVCVAFLQEENAAELVVNYAVARKLF